MAANKEKMTKITVEVPQGLYWVVCDLLDAEWTSLTARTGARRGRELYDAFIAEAVKREVQRRRREGTQIKPCVTHYGYFEKTQ
jgi:hypothetical protein